MNPRTYRKSAFAYTHLDLIDRALRHSLSKQERSTAPIATIMMTVYQLPAKRKIRKMVRSLAGSRPPDAAEKTTPGITLVTLTRITRIATVDL